MPQNSDQPKTKTSKVSLLIAGGACTALLTGLWVFNANPEYSDKLTDVENAEKTIRAGNLEPVTVGGYSPYGCDRGEWFATRFIAKNRSGEQVSGTVCKTLFGRSRLTFEN